MTFSLNMSESVCWCVRDSTLCCQSLEMPHSFHSKDAPIRTFWVQLPVATMGSCVWSIMMPIGPLLTRKLFLYQYLRCCQAAAKWMDTLKRCRWSHILVKLLSVFLFLRESRRKTPTAVCLKENERLLGDSALGMVRRSLSDEHRQRGSKCSQC